MKSRKDQVQAYFFVVGRLAAAVTHGKPDVLQPPARRVTTGTVFGFLLTALLAAIFGIYGLFVPGNDTSWRHAGAIVMDKSSGARYVYLDGALRPVINYASARLVAGPDAGGKVVAVSSKSLAGTPVGQPVGITGAPDALPSATALYRGDWSVCVQPPGSDPAVAGPAVTLLLAEQRGRVLTESQAILAYTSDGSTFLIWQGKRLRVPDTSQLRSLGYGDLRPVAVTPAWLNPIQQGPDLVVPAVAGTGSRGPVIDGRPMLAGQLVEVRNQAIKTDQLFLVRADGITPVSRTVAALLLAAPSTRAAYPGALVEPIPVSAGALSGVPTSSGPALGTGLPPDPPELLAPDQNSLSCVAYPVDAAAPPQVRLVDATAVRSRSMPMARHQAGTTADRVVIPAGTGVLARQQAVPGAPPGAAFLITELGMRYPVAGPDVMGALGYAETSAVPVPAGLLGLLPAGPLLSADAARSSPA
ncbi:type VII secretion protein EccB [Amycolatopsis sp. cg5]|uniref:type VII secretion protein EccB n=1 Tax=Amycolatopsis sp. cg5 TaxID=3238802 RepID=UPI0035241AEE